MHLYWCVDCKTPDCKRRQVFKGVTFSSDASDASDDPTMQFSLPAKFKLRCTTCGNVHTYGLKDVDEFRSEESLAHGFEMQV